MRALIVFFALVLTAAAGRYGLEELKRPPRAENGPVEIKVRPLVLDSSNPERTRLGELHFLGAWELSGEQFFGGLSSLTILPDGQVRSLNDTATMFTFAQPGSARIEKGEVKRLPILRLHKGAWKPGSTDSESMAFDRKSGLVWVGFEMTQMVCRYSPGVEKAQACRTWPEMKGWTDTSSIESLARLGDGRFILIAEGAHGYREGRDVLLFSDDPAEDDSKSPMLMNYLPPTGYDPTDAVEIGDGTLLVLNRRATFYQGFTAVITLVDIRDMRPGVTLPSREIARFVPPILSDNFEGLALERGPNGERFLWMVSDDNHLFFQRTLLLKFALPDHF